MKKSAPRQELSLIQLGIGITLVAPFFYIIGASLFDQGSVPTLPPDHPSLLPLSAAPSPTPSPSPSPVPSPTPLERVMLGNIEIALNHTSNPEAITFVSEPKPIYHLGVTEQVTLVHPGGFPHPTYIELYRPGYTQALIKFLQEQTLAEIAGAKQLAQEYVDRADNPQDRQRETAYFQELSQKLDSRLASGEYNSLTETTFAGKPATKLTVVKDHGENLIDFVLVSDYYLLDTPYGVLAIRFDETFYRSKAPVFSRALRISYPAN